MQVGAAYRPVQPPAPRHNGSIETRFGGIQYGRAIKVSGPVVPSGRDAKRAARTARASQIVPYITRKIPYYEVLNAEGLELLEHNADTILQEIGIDFRDDPESLQLLKDAGADVQGERVRFPRGMCRTIVSARRRRNSPNTPAIRPAKSSSAANRRSSRPRMARLSCAASTRAVVTPGSRTSAISSSSPTCRTRCITPAARSASRSTCPSTSATSTWCTAI